jgi:hypothetical protein
VLLSCPLESTKVRPVSSEWTMLKHERVSATDLQMKERTRYGTQEQPGYILELQEESKDKRERAAGLLRTRPKSYRMQKDVSSFKHFRTQEFCCD